MRGCAGKTKCRAVPLTAAAMRRSRSGCDVRLAMDRQHRVGLVVRVLVPSGACLGSRRRAIGTKSRVASAITSPTTSRRPPARLRSRAACAERSSGQKRTADRRSTSIRFRSSGIDRSKLRRPASTCATGTSPTAARAPATVVFVSPSTTTQSGRSLRDRRANRRRHRLPGRRCAGRAGTEARAGRARRRRPATARRPSAARCARRPRRSPPPGTRARAAPT